MRNSSAAHQAYWTSTAFAVRRAVLWMGLVSAALRARWMPVGCAMGPAKLLMWKALAVPLLLMRLACAIR